MFSRVALVLVVVAGTFSSGTVRALDEVTPQTEYRSKIAATRSISALPDDLFGDSINSYTGSLQFSVVDASIPGNNNLDVQVARHLDVNETRGKLKRHRAQGAPFRNWDFDIPHLHGLFSSTVGWQAGPVAGIRCNQPDPTKAAPPPTGSAPADTFWSGNFLYVPGRGNEEIVHVGSSSAVKPTTGGPYLWMTKSLWYFSCLTTTANGTGDSFHALSPDGTKYWFNQIASRPAAYVSLSPAVVPRSEVWFLPTRIEDRFGNYVTYTYSPTKSWNLTRVEASDGRYLSISYNTKATGPYVDTVTDGLRSWRYEYLDDNLEGQLTAVVLPDSRKITYSFGDLSADHVDQAFSGCGSAPGFLYAPDFNLVATHPSGVTATFKLNMKLHGRTYVPRACWVGQNDSFDLVPKTFATLTLTGKQLAGVGLATPKTWSWTFPPYMASGKYADECTSTACATSKQVSTTQPDGSTVKETYGIKYDDNEGMLLSSEIYATGNSSATKAETYSYQTSSVGRPYPQHLGVPTRTYMDPSAMTLRPQVSKQIAVDGVTFVKKVASTCNGNNTPCFDALARPLIEEKYSSGPGMGFSRTEALSYYDNLNKWTLGQAATLKCIAPAECTPSWAPSGIVISQTNFDANSAVPIAKYRFGKLTETISYWADGTVATSTDGNGNITSYSSWKRGIPQIIQFTATAESPGGSTQLMSVTDAGWISAVTDEVSSKTCFAYDLMGRLTEITYPSESTPATCDTSEVDWKKTRIAFEPVAAAEYGISANHWRQTSTTGNHVKITYFDALWRPVLTREYDATNSSGTTSFRRFGYDSIGRKSFRSYAGATDNITTGVRSEYDVIGRPVAVREDSELGQLVTSTAYQSGFKTLATNPKGYQTQTIYRAYDSPSYEEPHGISELNGDRHTEIYRDVFGKPQQVHRRNGFGNEIAKRYYVYDNYQQLCKTVEPETGATIMDYDGAGNLQWSAAGTGLTGITSCDTIAGRDSGRKVTRYYDARNRLKELNFPDLRGNQAWTYTRDGLPETITTWNGLNNDGPVINRYNYDKRRKLKAESVEQPAWYGWGISYVYDANGNLASQTYPTGLVVNYAPNALGQPTQAGAYATGAQYHPNGALKQFTYGNGIVHTMSQNARELPKRVTDSSNAMDFEYSYDKNANISSIEDYVIGTPTSQNRMMGYDELDRLLWTSSQLYGVAQVFQYKYDALDNLKSAKLELVKDYAHYVYDPATNQLLNIKDSNGATVIGFGYDPQGNVTNKNGRLFDFDFGNRLRSTPEEWYRYDGYGRRVLNWRSNEPGVLSQYSRSGQLLYDENYRASVRKSSTYIYLAGSLVATKEWNFDISTGATKYQHTDVLGSPVAVTDAAGSVIDRTNYEPYGATFNEPTYDGFGYAGHVRDSATGLNYMQQRYYDSDLGRFISVDPVSATNLAFNRYNYGNNNPYKFIDPDGRNVLDWLIKMLGGDSDDPDAVRTQMAEISRAEVEREAESVKVAAQDMAAIVVKATPEPSIDFDATGHILFYGVRYEQGNELNWTDRGLRSCSTLSQCSLFGPGMYTGLGGGGGLQVGDMTEEDMYFGFVLEGGAVEKVSFDASFNSSGGSISGSDGGGAGGVAAFKVCRVEARVGSCN